MMPTENTLELQGKQWGSQRNGCQESWLAIGYEKEGFEKVHGMSKLNQKNVIKTHLGTRSYYSLEI